ncbi:MAG: hypothetical protein ABL876_16590, partial [Chitinophagaceae bacterium]
MLLIPGFLFGQVKWQNVDSLFQPLPASVHVYSTTDPLDGKPNIAYYVEADLKDKKLDFTADTTFKRRLTPSKFYEKNGQPLLVVNTTFFSFATNQNLNVVIKKGKLVSYNVHTINGRGKDTFTYRHPFIGAIGISKRRFVDIAWVHTDSAYKIPYALNQPVPPLKDSSLSFTRAAALNYLFPPSGPTDNLFLNFYQWKMRTAVG